MTLVIGLKTKGGMVIAADSRASSMLTSNDTVQKIFQLGANSAVGVAGDGPLAIYFLDQIKGKLNYGTGISDLAEQIRIIGKQKFNDFFEHLIPDKRPSLVLILLGYTTEKEKEIYTLDSRDNFVPRKCITGFECIGVPYIANYLLNRLYEIDINLSSGKDLSIWCMKEVSSQDKSVGGLTRVATFSNTQSFKEISSADVKAIEEKMDKIRVAQKSAFYPEDPGSGVDLANK